MARPLRIEYEGAVYHITSRGNARKSIFRDDADRKLLLDILARVNERYTWICHAYCLMTNHYHLVIETRRANLSQGMRHLNGLYTQSYNRRHHRVGHVFQGRFKAIVVEKENYLLELSRYVVLNPVRAKMVAYPSAWKWSSYSATAALSRPHESLTTDWLLEQFAKRKDEAQRRYRKFVKESVGKSSIWKDLKGHTLLGSEGFVQQMSRYLRRKQAFSEIPKRQRYVDQPKLTTLFSKEVREDKSRRDSRIREAVMNYGYTQKQVADCLGMHYATISRLVNPIE